MKRRGYRFGVQWIAENDEPSCLDARDIENQISCLFLADLFGKDSCDVANDIAHFRCNRDPDLHLNYFDADGTLRNADGSRSIFDDVDA